MQQISPASYSQYYLHSIGIPQKNRYSHNIAIAASTPDFAAALADAKAWKNVGHSNLAWACWA